MLNLEFLENYARNSRIPWFFIGWLPCGTATGASLEFPRILVIASEQSDRSNLGILEFPSFFSLHRKDQRVAQI